MTRPRVERIHARRDHAGDCSPEGVRKLLDRIVEEGWHARSDSLVDRAGETDTDNGVAQRECGRGIHLGW